MHGSISLMLLLPKKVRENVVQSAGSASFPIAVNRPVAFGEVVGADERVVDEGLEDDGHEACLSHVVQASKPRGCAGCDCGVARKETLRVAVGVETSVLPLPAAVGADLFEGGIVDEVLALVAIGKAIV